MSDCTCAPFRESSGWGLPTAVCNRLPDNRLAFRRTCLSGKQCLQSHSVRLRNGDAGKVSQSWNEIDIYREKVNPVWGLVAPQGCGEPEDQRHPDEMGAAEVKAFLTHLAVNENVAGLDSHLIADDLDQHPLAPPTIELTVELLLPRAERLW